MFELNARGDAVGDFFGDAVGGTRDAAADGLSNNDKIGIEFPFAGAAPGTGADGMRFVGDEERTVVAGGAGGGAPGGPGGGEGACPRARRAAAVAHPHGVMLEVAWPPARL